jgi:hypothetical protein
MMKMLLDDLTEEQYWKLRKEHKTNQNIANALHVHAHTLYKRTVVLGINGKVHEKIINERRKKEIERVELVNKMRNEGCSPDEITEALGFSDKNTYYSFCHKARRRGLKV